MSEPRRFNARVNASAPHPFVLEYVHLIRDEHGEVIDREDAEQSFLAVGVAPPSVILSFTEKVEDVTGQRPASAILGFMGAVLAPDDLTRWDALMSSVDDEVDVAVIGAVVEWLMEIYNKRPTQPS